MPDPSNDKDILRLWSTTQARNALIAVLIGGSIGSALGYYLFLMDKPEASADTQKEIEAEPVPPLCDGLPQDIIGNEWHEKLLCAAMERPDVDVTGVMLGYYYENKIVLNEEGEIVSSQSTSTQIDYDGPTNLAACFHYALTQPLISIAQPKKEEFAVGDTYITTYRCLTDEYDLVGAIKFEQNGFEGDRLATKALIPEPVDPATQQPAPR